MKTIIATVIALSATTASAQTPNNYIGTDSNGVISERVGNDPANVITQDMATQAELNRVDQEDHRVVDATVNADGVLVLHSQDMDGGSKRNLVTGAQITGQDGTDGTDGKDAVAPLGSLSFAAASASFYGDGMGFGLSASNYGSLEGSVVIGFDLDNNWRVVGGITTDFNDRHAVSVGVGVSF
tara:strand:- start:699 stop:1247 length:549 start_codon:yes stop_codon:yes gene_type:complete